MVFASEIDRKCMTTLFSCVNEIACFVHFVEQPVVSQQEQVTALPYFHKIAATGLDDHFLSFPSSSLPPLSEVQCRKLRFSSAVIFFFILFLWHGQPGILGTVPPVISTMAFGQAQCYTVGEVGSLPFSLG